MKVGQIYLERASAGRGGRFSALVELLDRLAIEQHVLVADAAIARRLDAAPYVTVGPIVRTPVMAYCLMPDVDVVHVHDEKSEKAGLLLMLTRSVPFVLTRPDRAAALRNPLRRAVLQRAQGQVDGSLLDTEDLVKIYQRAANGRLELPEDANSG